MAEAVLKSLDTLTCPICLDLLKVPVAVLCGHSFCEGCIKDYWDQEDQKGVYSCPQCRHTFTPRPVLNKNTMLAELAEALRATRPQAAPPADSPGSGDVECDVCIGAKHKAVKSCLVCLASYCEVHIQPHYQSPALKKHKLVDASVNLQEKISSLHDKLLDIFCRTDQQCICYLCVMDEHSGHKTVSAAAARSGKQNQLVETQGKLQLRVQQTENKVQEVRQAMDTFRSSAQTAVEDSERHFTELNESIERKRSEVKEQIRAQEKAELSAAEDLLEKLEQEMADLRRRDAELEQHTHRGSRLFPPASCVCSKMAEAVLKSLDTLTCPICLDLLKVPVTVPCGHSFCEGCIKDCWDQEDQKGVYSCPQCRHTFTPRPVLNKNTMLAELAEALRTTRPQAAPPADSPTGSGDVECDLCIGAKLKAVKSCLVCLASYCEAHIQPHFQSPALKKHKLVEASMNLQEKICSLHEKLLKVFCRNDQQCICYLCVMDEHNGHKTVSAAAARSEKQKQLVETQEKFQQRIQQTEKTVQELRKAINNLRSSAQTAVEDSERLFTELIESIERRRSEVKEQIRAQEKAELSAAEDLLEKLEQEMVDLRRRDAELEQLSHTEDHIHFLQSFQSLSAPPQTADFPHVTLSPQFSLEDLKTAMTGAMERVKAGAVQFSGVSVSHEPKSREDFLKYSCRLTLDPNTSNRYLGLSERNRKLTVTRHPQKYPDHPERFEKVLQVLCRETLSGRCYWEVEFECSDVDIAICYKDISRKGKVKESRFGNNDQSWSLNDSGSSFYFSHNNKHTDLPVKSISSRIGVYVDTSAGILSFYSVSDTMTLLHRIQTSFTQPLYAGFGFYEYGTGFKFYFLGNVVKICDLN